MMVPNDPVEFLEIPGDPDEAVDPGKLGSYKDTFVFGTDWTTETIVSQMERGNIGLNPRFQRRDAWSVERKSEFIESLLIGLPIPQIVLAEQKDSRGRFLVLDGKQRLLSLLQFWGSGEGAKNAYRLTDLKVRQDLNRLSFADLRDKSDHLEDYNYLLNQTIRTVVIRNWPSDDFLHLVFLRLNTASIKLSPQELRQAMSPGPFSEALDDWATANKTLQKLLRITEPDYRMRDVELAGRFIAFRQASATYKGRMKEFLDGTFKELNAEWQQKRAEIEGVLDEFTAASQGLMDVFGEDRVARKPGGVHLIKAIFDPLAYFFSDEKTRTAAKKNGKAVVAAYDKLFKDTGFNLAISRDTSSIDNTKKRFSGIRTALESACKIKITASPVEGL